jgi:hypothetical protein
MDDRFLQKMVSANWLKNESVRSPPIREEHRPEKIVPVLENILQDLNFGLRAKAPKINPKYQMSR